MTKAVAVSCEYLATDLVSQVFYLLTAALSGSNQNNLKSPFGGVKLM